MINKIQISFLNARTKVLIVCISILAIASSESKAQDQKIGYFESDIVVAQLPEYGGIEQRLQLLSSGWQQEAQEMLDEVTALEEDYQAKEILYTEEIRSQKLAEIAEKKNNTKASFSKSLDQQGNIFSNKVIY